MFGSMKIKKELTQEAFDSLLVECEERCSLLHNREELIVALEETICQIIPAFGIHVLVVNSQEGVYHLPTSETTYRFEKGLLAESFRTKQPFILNLVEQSFLYHPQYDNLSHEEIKGILVVPIVDESPTNEVVAMVWASTAKGSLNQYTKRDIDYMNRFSRVILAHLFGGERPPIPTQPTPTPTPSFPRVSEREDEGYYKRVYEALEAKYKKEQAYFSATVHDIRTPMNGVIGFLELLETMEEDSKKQEYIKSALSSGRDMVMLINDILDFSKISSGNMTVEHQPFSPLEAFSDISKLFFINTQKRGIDFCVFIDPMLPVEITSDYHRIKQVMSNLLSNALKFTPKGGEISLRLEYDASRDALRVSVRDTGAGIAKDRQEAIFSPYTQEKDSTSREYGGTGLGLSISQQLIVLLGGKLELESVEGEGSEFYFSIPCQSTTGALPIVETQEMEGVRVLLHQGRHTQKPHTMKAVEQYFEAFGMVSTWSHEGISLNREAFDLLVILREDATHNEEKLQELLDKDFPILIVYDAYINEHNWFVGRVERLYMPLLPKELATKVLTILRSIELEVSLQQQYEDRLLKKCKNKLALVVDDNSINRQLMKVMLERYHFGVIVCESGEDALIESNREYFDLIFMDENMLGLSGVETVQEVRRLERDKGTLIPSIIFGYTGDTGREIKEAFINAGANDVVTKPITLKRLEEVIINYL